MKYFLKNFYNLVHSLFILAFILVQHCIAEPLPLFYWQPTTFTNFGDYLSLKVVERMVKRKVKVYQKNNSEKKLLAIGSILTFAQQDDVVWGSGVNGKYIHKKYYNFDSLDVRAVRGPLTREFLKINFNIECPEIYGDPALLIPQLFPEFKRKKNPQYEYIIIPHYSEAKFFDIDSSHIIVLTTEPWDEIIEKILDSKLVISTSLHGIIVAEAFGIPARLLRLTNNEPLFKFKDYYFGTGRPDFKVAYSIIEALAMGGEKSICCNLKKLYKAFPFEFWK